MKTCLQCQQDKPLGEFYKQAKSPDGYQRYCKNCGYGIGDVPQPSKLMRTGSMPATRSNTTIV